MSKLIENYQPDNRIFRNILLSVLSIIAGVYYACIKSYVYRELQWYDWLITIILCVGVAGYLFLTTGKYGPPGEG